MNQYTVPNIETHIPEVAKLPDEPKELAVGRPDEHTPSLWQSAVKIRHKATGKPAVVVRVDWSTNMFRAFYPTEGEIDPDTRQPRGRFAERTEWQHCRDWDVEVTFSPKELARQAAAKRLEDEIAKLNPTELGSVMILCDDPDPAKALGKLEALRMMGVIKASPEAAQAAVAEGKKK